MISRTAASAPTTSGVSGPWPPPWPVIAAPGCGVRGNGGDRSGNDGRVGFRVARDAGAPLLWGRPARAIDGEACSRAAPPAVAASRLARSELCGAEEGRAPRWRWPAVRRCAFFAGARVAGPATLGTDATVALWVARCASATAFDATAAACLVATSRLFVAASIVFDWSTGATAPAADACGTMAVAWVTAAFTSWTSCAVPKGSAAWAVAGITRPQAIAAPRAHALRALRPARGGETSGLTSTGRSRRTFSSSRRPIRPIRALMGTASSRIVSADATPAARTRRRRPQPPRARLAASRGPSSRRRPAVAACRSERAAPPFRASRRHR